jgi:glycosyltransferase involved in cell wall biosynthesis
MIALTIITCTYQAEAVLERTLDSVLMQTHGNVEHLIVDGASTDGTLTLAEDYRQRTLEAENGHRVTIVSEPDKGLYDAMNKAIARATGDYLVFLNAGDVLPARDTLEQIVCSVADGETLPGVLYGDTDVVNMEGHFMHHRRLQPPAHLTWRSFRQGMLVCHQAFYARTDLARETPYNLHYRLSADVDWCIRVMKAAEQKHLTLRNVGLVVVNYLEGGMSIKNHRASLKERFHIMRDHYGLLTTLMMHCWFVLRIVLHRGR